MSEEGKLASFADLERVDNWSRAFHEEFEDWLPTTRANWSTWTPGYLLLELIADRAGEASEPAFVYSADEELTFATRVWHDHSPHWDFPETKAGEHVKDVATRWFAGKFLIATYYLGDQWKGSLTIDHDEDIEAALQKGVLWVRERFDADRVELKGPFKSDDRTFVIDRSGVVFA